MNINVYSNTNCIACKMTQKVLKSMNVPFNHDKLSNHPKMVKQAKAKGYMSAPYVTITDKNGQLIKDWAGFQPDKIMPLKKKTSQIKTITN